MRPVAFRGIADTGCQSCLAGYKLLQSLGLQTRHLIPVSMRMNAANEKAIKILGALILRISGITHDGKEIDTKQIVYFTDNNDKFYLSKQACVALGLIHKDFPTLGQMQPEVAGTIESNTEHRSSNTCSCPPRQLPPPPITTLPFPATPDNRERLESYLRQYYQSSTFNTCEHQPLPMMQGPPLRMMIDENVTPVAYHTPIPVPFHWMDEVKTGLDRDVQLGVIEPVPVGEPVTWCHRMVICPKKSGKPRRTVDFQSLNKHAVRETHHTQSPFLQARSVPHNVKKTVFDAWNGYHSIPLHENDRHYTTFITPWGRYRYCVAPQGYIASGDGYSRRFDEIAADFPRKTKCIDDTLLWSSDIEQSFLHAAQWLDLCGRNGITLNPDKFVFAKDTVEFAGFEISTSTVKPCSKLFEAIANFPTPQNITDMRSWFGLINQVSYAFASAEKMAPFRSLLKPNTPFEWTTQLDSIFKESKKVILEELANGVTIFDKQRSTCLATDWSKTGIGFWLLQKHCKCTTVSPLCCNTGWKIVLVGSRFTSSAESRYQPIEGEALAVVDALEKARHFVLGCDDLIVAVDHKPLLKVLGDRNLEDIPNPRLRNIKEKSLRYRFRLLHVPGARHKAADGVSRHPAGEPTALHLPDDQVASATTSLNQSTYNLLDLIRQPYETSLQDDPDIAASLMAPLKDFQSITWDDVRCATTSDPHMHILLSMIENGLPDQKNQFPDAICEFYRLRDHLQSYDGVILYRDRVLIPPSLRSRVLKGLHSAHQGTSSMIARAEASVFWPGITPAIHELRANCTQCNRMAPSQPNPPPTPPMCPVYPFQAICADFFHHQGTSYLVVVDRYSNWPIVERSKDGAKGLISCLRRTFVTFGISEEIATDGGPEFIASSTQKFLHDWGVRHRVSSVGYPHSNCRAELGVKTTKRLITDNTGPSGELDTDAFQRAMLQYRNTPDKDTNLSPAQCIFGRAIRDFIPVHPGRYEPHPTWKSTLIAREEALRHRHLKTAESLNEHTRLLPPLAVGDTVRIQNQVGPHPNKWDKTGTIVEVKQFDQYVVRVDGSGRVTLRNRKFLRKFLPVLQRELQYHYRPSPRNSRLQSLTEEAGTPDTNRSTPPNMHTTRDVDNASSPDNPQPPVTSVAKPDESPTAGPPIADNHSAPTAKPQTKPIPRALQRLLPHNEPGLRDIFPDPKAKLMTSGPPTLRSSQNRVSF